MDYTHDRERAGCSDLFAATTAARPFTLLWPYPREFGRQDGHLEADSRV